MTFLVTICILGKCDDNKARLNRIFDLFDFDKLKQVNIDELVRIDWQSLIVADSMIRYD